MRNESQLLLTFHKDNWRKKEEVLLYFTHNNINKITRNRIQIHRWLQISLASDFSKVYPFKGKNRH